MPLARRLSNSSLGSCDGVVKSLRSERRTDGPRRKSTATTSVPKPSQGSSPALASSPSIKARRQSRATQLVQEPETKSMLTSRRKSLSSSSSASSLAAGSRTGGSRRMSSAGRLPTTTKRTASASARSDSCRPSTFPSTVNPKKRTKNDKENESSPSHSRKSSKRMKQQSVSRSPGRVTRSSKKQKLALKSLQQQQNQDDGNSNADTVRDGLMLFSPPDQKENARREKENNQRRLDERNRRVEVSRKKGNLLEFSSDLESLTTLPMEEIPDEKENLEAKVERTLDGESGEEELNDPIDYDTSSKSNLEDLGSTKTTVDGGHGQSDSETAKAVAALGVQVEEIHRRLSGMSQVQPPPPVPKPEVVSNPADKMRIEAQDKEIQALSETKQNLEERNRQLSVDIETIKSKMSVEVERLMDEKSRLKTEFEGLEQSEKALKLQVEDYENKTRDLEGRVLPESEAKLLGAKEEIEKYKRAVEDKLNIISQLQEEINALNSRCESIAREKEEEASNFRALFEEGSQVHKSLRDEINEKTRAIADLHETVSSAKVSLNNEHGRVVELETKLESTLNDLQTAIQARDSVETELRQAKEQITKDAEFKEDVIVKNKESSATVKAMEEDRQTLNRRLKQLEMQLAETKEERDAAVFRLGTSDKREDELFERLRESDRVRRELHARVMYLSGNIRVFVRVRPLISGEAEDLSDDDKPFRFGGNGGLNPVEKSKYGSDDPTKNLLEVVEPKKDRGGLSQRRKKWTFGFDQIFDPSCTQRDIWDGCEPLIQSAIDGYYSTIFAYGQTGSGKTYTMLGEEAGSTNEGIMSRAIRKLFEAKSQIEELSRGEKQVSLSVELLEIYNENVRDLLSRDKQESYLKIVANEAVGSTHQQVGSETDVFQILEKAQARRCVKATASNATSSRSHMLFTIEFNVRSKDGTNQTGKLHVCDLAGSERLSKSGANNVGGALLNETKHINLSLSTLSNVIEKLQAGDKNIPFRESKLTTLLQNSLGGNSKTLCIVCANPLQAHFHETLCSLRFAAKINKVDLKAQQNFSA